MAINYNNSVSNGTGTPTAITGVIADRPAAANVAEGTIYISTDTQEIFSAQAGSWILVSGGGGGTPTWDAVLAVGNIATNKNAVISGSNGSLDVVNGLAFINLTGAYIYMLDQNFNNSEARIFCQGGIQRLFLQNFNSNNEPIYLDYQNDTNGKNVLVINTQGSSNVNDFRRFVVNASYTGGNDFTLIESSQSGQVTNYVKAIAEIGTDKQSIEIFETDTTIPNFNVLFSVKLFSKKLIYRVNPAIGPATGFNLFFTNNSPIANINTPDFSGTLANVNERINDNAVDLSVGSYNATNYGVYVIITGDNLHKFLLDNFVTFGTDYQFITLCVKDTPVKCDNSIGTIFGTATINSKGLFKLMKVGNDIYSSHI